MLQLNFEWLSANQTPSQTRDTALSLQNWNEENMPFAPKGSSSMNDCFQLMLADNFDKRQLYSKAVKSVQAKPKWTVTLREYLRL